MAINGKIFGQMLAQLMEKANVNQTELAKIVGVSQAAVSEWLRGKSIPKHDKLTKIAIYFKVPIHELTGEKEHIIHALKIIKARDIEDILTELKELGISEQGLDFVRALHKKELDPLQIDLINAILYKGKKCEE